MRQHPKFSIVIPTRNRPHLIGYAIESALGQTVRDLEVVISDNSSNEETGAVVAKFADERVRYVRTDRVLGMPDNWDNALNHSSGTWVVLVEDDCVLASRCLEFVERALELRPSKLVAWNWYGFFPAYFPDPVRRSEYVVSPFTSGVRHQSARQVLERVFAFRFDWTMPRPYNACVHRDLIDELKQSLGRVYSPPAPDYTFLTAVLALVDQYTLIDVPLMMSSAGGTSPHASPKNFTTFLTELDNDKRGGWTPLRRPVVGPWNIIAESMCHMQTKLPALRDVQLDIERYLVDFRTQLAEFDDLRFEIESEKQAYEEFVRSLPLAQQVRVRAGYARRRVRWVGTIRAKKVVFRYAVLRRAAEQLVGKNVVRGAEHGFNDVLGAMRHLETRLVPLHADG